MLIVISGLPATGKTTLAAALARRIGAVHLSVDLIEDAMLGAGMDPGWTTGVAAYEAASAAAQQNLRLGFTVVVDAVNDSDPARETWRACAEQAGVEVGFVLLLPPTRTEHQRRLDMRERGLTHVQEPTWSQVSARGEAYEEWNGEPIKVPADEPVEQLVRRVVSELRIPHLGMP